MAKLFLRPSGSGGVTQLVPSGAAANWQCVDEVTPDDFTTYVWKLSAEFGSGGTFIDLYTLQDAAASVAGVINSVTIRYRGSCDGTGFAEQFRCGIRTGSATNYLDSIRINVGMETFTKEWTTNPRVGGAWTWAQVNALLLVAYMNLDGDEFFNPAGVQITWMEIEVDYDPQVTPTVASMVCAPLTPTVTATPDLVEVTPSIVAAAAVALAPSVSRLLLPAAAECSAIAVAPTVWRTVQPTVATCTTAAQALSLLRLALPAPVGCSLETLAPTMWRTALPATAEVFLTMPALSLLRLVSPATAEITFAASLSVALRLVLPDPADLVLVLPAPILGHALLPAVLDLVVAPLEIAIAIHRLLYPASLQLHVVPLSLLIPRADELFLSLAIRRNVTISMRIHRIVELEVER